MGGGVLNEVICFYKLGLSFVQSGIRDSVHVTRLSNKCTIYNLQFLNRPKTAVILLLYCRYGVKHFIWLLYCRYGVKHFIWLLYCRYGVKHFI